MKEELHSQMKLTNEIEMDDLILWGREGGLPLQPQMQSNCRLKTKKSHYKKDIFNVMIVYQNFI